MRQYICSQFKSKLLHICSISLFAVVLAFIIASCTTMPDGSIPRKIQTWAETNVWQVDTFRSTGSGFWISNTAFLTNCHVVFGSDAVTVENNDRSLVLPMTVKVCDRDADIALLEYKQGDVPFSPLPTIIAKESPENGQILYGPGYPLAGGLVLTTGHYMGHDIRWGNRAIITNDVIFGDSGSPALMLDWRGRVVVVGIRSGMRGFRNGYSTFFVTHISSIKDSHQVSKFLRENV